MSQQQQSDGVIATANADEAMLRELNAGYVRAYLTSDVDWYDAHLTDDFTCIRADGSIVGREEFLRGNRQDPGVEEYVLHEVSVRIHGGAALIGALGKWRRKDGTTGGTRYIDVWVATDGGWKAVSAQLTRATI